MNIDPASHHSGICPKCGAEISKRALICPKCQNLVHADRLRQLAWQVSQAEQENRLQDAMADLREAMELTPPNTRTYEALRAKIVELGRRADGLSPTPGNSAIVQEPKTIFGNSGRKAGILGLLIALLAKFKVLFLGLAKLNTLLSMLLFLGVYWDMWGWKFALGFVISIYIHEMGHVTMLNHYGIKASPPVFIPFVGAVVRVKQVLADRRENSRVGLAGPLWGLWAAVAAYALYHWTNDPIFAAIARTGAWINLFNLMPFWQLDGGRGFQSLSSWQRWVMISIMGLMLYYTGEKLLLVLMALAFFQAFRRDTPSEGDAVGMGEFAFLVVALSLMCMIDVPTTAS